MKKLLSCFCIFLLVLSVTARELYITRHGQRGDKAYWDAAAGEAKLTPLGREQAEYLAHYLVEKCRFNGVIYASPLYRTIETGLPTARLLHQKMLLEPGIQEFNPGPEPNPRGMTFAEIEQRFPGMTTPGSAFKEQWRVFNEPEKPRMERTEKALDRILKESKGDLLLVSHGSCILDLVRILNKRLPADQQRKEMIWNCSLFIYTLDDHDRPVRSRYTTEYIPDEKVTSNFRCPKIERPNDPRYSTRAQDEARRAARSKKSSIQKH